MTAPSATGGTSRYRQAAALAALVLSACSSEHIEPGEPWQTGSASVAAVDRGVANSAGVVSAGAPGLQLATAAAGSGGASGASVTTCSPTPAGGQTAAGNAAAGATAFLSAAGKDAAGGCGKAAAGHAAGTSAAVSGNAGVSGQP